MGGPQRPQGKKTIYTLSCNSSLRLPPKGSYKNLDTFFFFIRTSNFGVEAERSYIFLRFEPENVLGMFLKLCGIVFQ